jgi:hypothetical protein
MQKTDQFFACSCEPGFTVLGCCFPWKQLGINFGKKGSGYTLEDISTNSCGHPAHEKSRLGNSVFSLNQLFNFMKLSAEIAGAFPTIVS